MTTISARVEFEDRDHDQAVVRVTTSRCFYSVAIQDDTATVVGPGVEREFRVGDPNIIEWAIPYTLSYKGIAIIAVTLLEEEE